MRKRRAPSQDFNPEKFLAKEAKQANEQADPRRYLFRRFVVLEPEFRGELVDAFLREHPQAFDDAASFGEEAALHRVRTFLRRALRKKQLRVGEEMLGMLLFDFFLGLGERVSRDAEESQSDLPGAP